ncbi:MAG: hypothetical protein IKW98_08875 [Prevotella sp.]|nr:hypothetical protein [Prevotella sp.]
MNEMSGNARNGMVPAEPIQETPQAPLLRGDVGVNGSNGGNGVMPMYAELLDETVERPQVPVANGVNGGDGEKPVWPGYERYANWGKTQEETPQAPLLRGDNGVNGSNGVSVVTPSPKHVTDWSKGFAQGIANGAAKEKPLWEVMQDYDRWAKENNGEVLDSVSKYVLFNQYDPTKSIAQNEEEERHRKSQAKWEQIGNLFSHLGNFVGGMVGAPPQPLESGVALTERQRKIRDAVQAQRRQTANDMLSLWYKDIADKRAAELQTIRERKEDRYDKEQERKNALTEAQIGKYRAAANKDDAMTAYYAAKENALIEGKPLDDALKEAKIAKEQALANKASVGGSGGGRRSSSGSDNRETVSVTTKKGTTTERRTWKQEYKNSKGRPYGQGRGKGPGY